MAKANASPLAQEFIAFLLQPEMQVVLAKSSGSGPVNRKTVLSAEQQKGLPYGDAVAKLLTTDWDTVNANRDGVEQPLDARDRAVTAAARHSRRAALTRRFAAPSPARGSAAGGGR